jgi:bifunctional DNA-binding transcriptional regulator/antitoxin component of YhaV-PrlF toxin-antitoxin module
VLLKVDDRYRVVLDKEVREKLKVEPGDEVLAIPSTDGILLTSLKGKKFESSLTGFNYREELHEASRYLFGKTRKRKPNK